MADHGMMGDYDEPGEMGEGTNPGVESGAGADDVDEREDEEYPSAGFLVIFEGIDGAGKSTQAKAITDYLKGQGKPVTLSKWNSNEFVHPAISEAKDAEELTPRMFSLLYAADFGARWEQEIHPALHDDQAVVCERYCYTACVRDVLRGNEMEWVRDVYRFAHRPHLGIYLKTSVEAALARIIDDRGETTFYEAGQDVTGIADPEASFRVFQQKALDLYDQVAAEYDLLVIDADRPLEEVTRDVRAAVEQAMQMFWP